MRDLYFHNTETNNILENEKTDNMEHIDDDGEVQMRALGRTPMQTGSDSALSQLRAQEFLDEVSHLKVCDEHQTWFQVDVASMLQGCVIRGHCVDKSEGRAVIFLNGSVISCDPILGKIQHYPRGIVHLFVDDNRCGASTEPDTPLFAVELFSISPREEELSFILSTDVEAEVPQLQETVARWLGWLNQ